MARYRGARPGGPLSNPFLAPAEGDRPAEPAPVGDIARDAVVAMRFPHLLLGGLGLLGSLVVLGVAGLGLVASSFGTGVDLWISAALGVYAFLGLLYAVPAGLLVRSGLAGLLASADPDEVAVSLRAQVWFWRLLALYVLGITALYVLGFAAVIVAGLIGGA